FDCQLLIGGGAITQVQDYWGNSYFNPWLKDSNDEWRQYKGFCTDVLFDEAINWIKSQKNKPFFCYLASNAAHTPFYAPEKYKRPFLEKGLHDDTAAFYGMIVNLDDNLGKLRKVLEETGIAENTLLIFLTDNGSTLANGKNGFYNAGLRGGKASIYDGGSRAAAFFNWPGTLRENYKIDQLAMHYDLLPTLSDLCGIPLLKGNGTAAVDGISLRPFLMGEKTACSNRYYIVYQGFWPPDQPLRQYENTSIRSQNFRLANGKELYDLRSDPGEKTNVINDFPKKFNELKRVYEQWWAGMADELPELRVYKPYPVGEMLNAPVTMCALHYYDSTVYPAAQKWFETLFYEQSGLAALLRDEQSSTPKNEPLMGSWKMDFKSAGTYRFVLGKGTESTPAALTEIRPGKAHVRVGNQQVDVSIEQTAQHVGIDVEITEPGIQMVECWFSGQRTDGKPSGAYFVHIFRTKDG
ncbi:MAG: sulfatase-like hydrolase/transferase, partial [Kiritimatiellales bacterium]